MDDLRGLMGVVCLFLCGSSADCGLLLTVMFLFSVAFCGVDDMTFLLGVVGNASILLSPSFATDFGIADLSETTVPLSNVLARL